MISEKMLGFFLGLPATSSLHGQSFSSVFLPPFSVMVFSGSLLPRQFNRSLIGS